MALRVVVAPDSFKGTATARDAAAAIARGWRRVRPADDVVEVPLADGGEGTLEVMRANDGGSEWRDAGPVTGPHGRPVRSGWLALAEGTALVELAISSGLPLMRRPDALAATTRGLGETIAAALAAGATRLVVALGGSATTDGGAGALAALGARLLDARGRDLPDGGAALAGLARIEDLPPLPPTVLLTDVDAPLTGPTGAAAVFGPQKGASPADVAVLDDALTRFATVLGGDPNQPGAGAAGGTAFGLARVGGVITPGAPYLATLAGLPLDVDVILTGEGRFDAQSTTGKVVGHVLSLPTRAVRGVIAGEIAAEPGVWSLGLTGLAGADATRHPLLWLERAGEIAAADPTLWQARAS